jgi:hypothetical protein
MEYIVDRDRDALSEARRKFLRSCGKFAVVTPPAVTLMLSAASRSYAATHSGLRHKAVPGDASSDGATRSAGAASSSDRGGSHDR